MRHNIGWAVAVLALVSACDAANRGKATSRETAASGSASQAARPVVPKRGRQVTRMAVRGFVALTRGGDKAEEPLPASPLGHGEFPTAIAARDSTVFVVGKLYTGKPGPDHGVVYMRDKAGWRIVYSLADYTFHSIVITAEKTVYVGAKHGFVYGDGDQWSFVKLPKAMLYDVWLEEEQVKLAAFDGSEAYLLQGRQTKSIAATKAPGRSAHSVSVAGTTYRIFDRSTEIGPATLSDKEAAEIDAEIKEIRKGNGRVRPARPGSP